MQEIYYVNHSKFQKGDVQKAWKYAANLLKKDSNIDRITILVYTSNQYTPFVAKELGIALKWCKRHTLPNRIGKTIEVHTVKTYSPGYLFQGSPNCELLIAVAIPPNEMEKLVDYSRAKYWIVVPWTMAECQSFLSINEAIDIDTKEAINAQYIVDDRIKGAIRWLMATFFPNEGYYHPNDMERLRKMANAIKHYNVPFERDSMINYCIHNGMCYDSALKTYEVFEKAHRRKLTTRQEPNYPFLLQMMEEK